MNRICREVQAQLPELERGTLGPLRRRLVRAHLRRCTDCRVERERQAAVSAGLEQIAGASPEAPDAAPDGLLDTLLEQAQHPGVRGRAAVPARGAVSGARPAMSVVLLVAGAAGGTAAGYAGWRAARAARIALAARGARRARRGP